MLRAGLGLIAGAVAAFLCVMVLETAGHMAFPPPEGLDISDPEQLATLMDEIPLGAKIAVLAAWAIATFVGGVVAAKVARRGVWPAWAIAGFMLLMIAINLAMIPHPAWMIVAAVVLTVGAGTAAASMSRA